MNDFIVTGIRRNGKKYLAAASYEERQLTELCVRPVREESRVGKIYIGYVENAAKNIGGAFIRVSEDFKCFLPNYRKDAQSGAAETGYGEYGSGNSQGHMLIRVTKDASGVKEAVCSTTIEIAGRYSVVSAGKTSLSVSKKLSDEEKALLKKWVNPHDYPGVHILLRTNAAAAEKQEVLSELCDLTSALQELYKKAESAVPGTCLYTPEPFYISMLRDLYTAPDRTLSDIPHVADELMAYREKQSLKEADLQTVQSLKEAGLQTVQSLKEAGLQAEEDRLDGVGEETDGENACLIRPQTLTLAQLYNLEHDLDRLTQKIVWLKSGAYLVIERTEAAVIIDVNTGRCNKGRIPEETYRKINLEAGEEVLRQLRLRDLSGMILIDFINLSSEDHREELVNVMKKRARKEHRRTEVFDLTRLGILEMVREKKEKPLDEIFES